MDYQWEKQVDFGKWLLTICVDRVDEGLRSEKIEDIIQTTLLIKEKPSILPLEANRGLLFGGTWVETC